MFTLPFLYIFFVCPPHPLCKSPLKTFRYSSILCISSLRNVSQGFLIYLCLDSLLHACHFNICLYHPTGKNRFTSFFCCITQISYIPLSSVSSLILAKYILQFLPEKECIGSYVSEDTSILSTHLVANLFGYKFQINVCQLSVLLLKSPKDLCFQIQGFLFVSRILKFS